MSKSALEQHVGIHQFQLGGWPSSGTRSQYLHGDLSTPENEMGQLVNSMLSRTRTSRFLSTYTHIAGQASRSRIHSASHTPFEFPLDTYSAATAGKPFVWVVFNEPVEPDYTIAVAPEEVFWTTGDTVDFVDAEFDLDLSQLDED